MKKNRAEKSEEHTLAKIVHLKEGRTTKIRIFLGTNAVALLKSGTN
jgi:hypothetical protein